MEDIITKARAFVANHAQEPRYGAVDEMVRGLLSVADERAVEIESLNAEITAIDDAVHGGSMEHTGLAHVVAQALSDAARAMEVAQMNHDRAYDALAVGLGLSEEHEARESLDALVKCALGGIMHLECSNNGLLKQLTAEQARGDNLSAEVKTLRRELAAAESKHTKAILDGGKVVDALVKRAHEIMTERDEALAMAESAMREGLSECERLRAHAALIEEDRDLLRGVVDAVRAIVRIEHYPKGWTPATVCEACNGNEISGCICGMVPGTEARRWVMEDVKDEKISHMGEVPESFER
jgi:hypothetical protein